MTNTAVAQSTYDPNDATYVRGDEWGVSYSVSYNPTVVTLGAYKSLPLPNEWGGVGVSVHHPAHGLVFGSVEAAEAFALRAGLIHRYDRTS